MTYILKHFKASEFLPSGFTDFTVMDEKILEMADEVRELVGKPLTINANGRNYCGYRPKDCKIGAPKSYHKRGMAVDLHCDSLSADKIRELIKKSIQAGGLKWIGGIELDVSWVHIDCRDRINDKVLWFKP